MDGKIPSFVRTLVIEEVRRIVADAVKDGGYISAQGSAAEVLRVYPGCGLTERDVADEIMIAAGKAGVAVEIGRVRIGAQPSNDARHKASGKLRAPASARRVLGKTGSPVPDAQV